MSSASASRVYGRFRSPSATSSESVVRCGQARYAVRSDGDRVNRTAVGNAHSVDRIGRRAGGLTMQEHRTATGDAALRARAGRSAAHPRPAAQLGRTSCTLELGSIARGERHERAPEASRPRTSRWGTTHVASGREARARRLHRAARRTSSRKSTPIVNSRSPKRTGSSRSRGGHEPRSLHRSPVRDPVSGSGSSPASCRARGESPASSLEASRATMCRQRGPLLAQDPRERVSIADRQEVGRHQSARLFTSASFASE